MSHINKLGGTRSKKLSNLATELWNYALNRNLIISAIHIPMKLDVLADHKSRISKDSIEWMLNPRTFRRVVAWSTRHRPICIESELPDTRVHIIVTRAKCSGNDAFNLTRNYHLSYLFPPFSLIHLCLKKIQRDQAECIFIAPVWKSRP